MIGEYDAALKIYAESAELGYEVGANNAAYLLDVGVARIEGIAPPSDKQDGSDSHIDSFALIEGGGERRPQPGGIVLLHRERAIGSGEGGAQPVSRDEFGRLINKAASLRFHWIAAEENNPDSFAAIGDSFFYGVGGAPVDYDKAIWWYSKAASAGSVKGA